MLNFLNRNTAIQKADPQERLRALEAQWIATAQQVAILRHTGQSPDVLLGQFAQWANAHGYSQSEIVEVRRIYPDEPIQRMDWLINNYKAALRQGKEEQYFAWAARCATPQEVQAVQAACAPPPPTPAELNYPFSASDLVHVPSTLPPVPYAQPIAPPQPVSGTTEELFESTPERDLTPLEQVGQAIALAYKEYEIKAEFVRPCDKGVRCDKLVFKKPTKVPFKSLETRKAEVISAAGLNPEDDIVFRSLPNNEFEIHLPRPRDQWRSALLLDEVMDKEVIARYRRHPNPIQALISEHFHRSPRSSKERLQVPFAIDLDGQMVNLDITSGCLLAGAPDSGKSVGLKTLIESAMLAYTPQQLEFALVDLKDGLTLSKFANLGYNSSYGVVTDAPGVFPLFEVLEWEKQERAKRLTSSGCENILEYNAVYSESIPWRVIVFEEVAPFKEAFGEEAEAVLYKAASQWRAYGIVLVIATQYPSKDKSISPATRLCFGSGVAFKGSQQCAELIFGDNDGYYTRMVARLTGAGDALIKQDGHYTRAQTLYVQPKHEAKILAGFRDLYGSRQSFQADGPDLFDGCSPGNVVAMNDRDSRDWEAICEAVRQLRRDGKQISQRAVKMAVWGSNADSGSNSSKYKRRLEDLTTKFNCSLEAIA